MRNSQDIPPKCIDPKYLKQSCKKEYIYIYIYIYKEREREREREYLPVCVGKIQIEWKRETNIYSKKRGRRRAKIKGR